MTTIATSDESSLQPDRSEQLFEVSVFLFLIVPSMALSFFAIKQGDIGFMVTAIATILRDLALVVLSLNGHQPGRWSIYTECSEQRELLLGFLAPVVWMAMSVPVSKCGIESLDDIVSCLKSSAFERQGAQLFPPRLVNCH
jgi:hypothetical protein